MAKAKTVPIKTLTPWAGRNFSVAPGDIINVPPRVAKARIAAGLAVEAPKDPPPAVDPDLDAKQIETASVATPENAAAPKATPKTAAAPKRARKASNSKGKRS